MGAKTVKDFGKPRSLRRVVCNILGEATSKYNGEATSKL